MDSFEKQLYRLASQQPDANAKALANFLFREVIEVAHSKYNISQEDIKDMCKDAVNRAALYLSIQNTDLLKPFVIYSICGLKWDNAEIDTDFAKDFINFLQSIDCD